MQRFLARSIVSTFIGLGLFGSSVAAVEVQVTKSVKPSSSTSLPHCIDDAKTLELIDQARKDNAKNAFKYDTIKAALHSDSDGELVARLIYSETLAAGCLELKNDLIPAIAGVIQNRIAKRKGDVKSVVYQRDQFASSLNGYDESKWRDFLCPTDKTLWEKSILAAKSKAVAPLGAYNYYLFKHSTRFQPPDWAKKPPVAFAGSEKIADCIKVFATEFK